MCHEIILFVTEKFPFFDKCKYLIATAISKANSLAEWIDFAFPIWYITLGQGNSEST